MYVVVCLPNLREDIFPSLSSVYTIVLYGESVGHDLFYPFLPLPSQFQAPPRARPMNNAARGFSSSSSLIITAHTHTASHHREKGLRSFILRRRIAAPRREAVKKGSPALLAGCPQEVEENEMAAGRSIPHLFLIHIYFSKPRPCPICV